MNGQCDFALVERELRHQSFGTLSTLTEQKQPHATGVVYAVSPPGEALTFYVTTRTTTRKVHNIRAHPEVAFVVPVRRRIVPKFPPRCIQFQGTATVVGQEHRAAIRTHGHTPHHRQSFGDLFSSLAGEIALQDAEGL